MAHDESTLSDALTYAQEDFARTQALVVAARSAQGSDLHDPRVAFLHIPKTAGTALTSLLECQAPTQRTLYVNWEVKRAPVIVPDDCQLILGHYDWELAETFLSKFRIVTLLREPVARIVSVYLHWRRTPPERIADYPHIKYIEIAKHRSLEGVLRADMPEIDRTLRNAQVRALARSTIETPCLTEEETLDRAFAHLEQVDFVGLTEAMPESVAMLFARYGWCLPGRFSSINTTPREYQVELTDTETELLLALTAADRKFYEYCARRFWEQFASFGWAQSAPRYEDAFRRRNPVPLTQLRLTFDGRIEGAGWHRREGGPPQHEWYWRWTGPGIYSFVDLPLAAARDLVGRIRMLNAISPDVHKSFHISLNGETLPHEIESDGRPGLIYRATLPNRLLARSPGLARLGFHVTHTRSYFDVEPTIRDFLPRGVALVEIAIDEA